MNAVVQFQARTSPRMDVELWSASLDASPQGMAVVEGERVLYANRAFAEMFGYARAAEMEGRELSDAIPGLEVNRQDGTAETQRDLASPSSFLVGEYHAIAKNGSSIHLEISFTDFHPNGRDLLLIHANRIPLARTAQRIQESQRMEALGRLVGGVAHDFNNLITGIMLYCDLLIPALAGQDRLLSQAAEIRKASEHGSGLIHQLLAVARRQTAKLSVLSWNEVVLDMQALLSRMIGENIELVTDLAENAGCVRMDVSQMQQVILNLVLNARDAMPEGGRVKIETRDYSPESSAYYSASMVELSVADTGCGMDEQTRTHLFEPFFTTKADGQGNGLGLFTVHGIATQDGGTIHVESEPGKGTRVIVRTPRVQ